MQYSNHPRFVAHRRHVDPFALSRGHKVLNVLIALIMVLQIFAPIMASAVESSATPAQEDLSPQDPMVSMIDVDLTDPVTQQRLQINEEFMPFALETEGLIRLESLNLPAQNSLLPNVGVPVVNPSLPNVPMPIPEEVSPFSHLLNDADTAVDDASSQDYQPDNSQPAYWPSRSIWDILFPTTPVENLAISNNEYVPMLSNWEFIAPDNTNVAPRKPSGFQSYLPLVNVVGVAPSNEIIVYPETATTFVSTDGLVRVRIPAHAYIKPFVLRYTPAQALTGGYWSLDAVTLDGKPVELNRSAQLYQQLPEVRSGKPLMFRYRDNASAVSLAAYVAENTAVPTARSTDNSGEFLTTPIYKFGQFTFASLDDEDNPDEGDDGLIVDGYCWEPSMENPSNNVFSYASVVSTTQEADPTGLVDFTWDEEDENGDIYQVDNWIAHDPAPEKNDFTLQPDRVYLGYQEIDGQTVPDEDDPIPFTTLITTSVRIGENQTGRYDYLDVTAYFELGTIACTAGCEGTPPTISGINLTQLGQKEGSSIGIGYLQISASDNSGDFSVSVRVNGVEYETVATNNGNFAAEIEYNIDDWNTYEIVVTDACGNAINFPPITEWGSDSIFNGGCPCSSFQSFVGDPINTQNGNYYDSFTDLLMPGVGGANITLNRDYNSESALWTGGATVQYTDDGSGNLVEDIVAGPPQYYGTAWTFPYAVSVNHLDLAPLYDGVEIHYPDGHSATFVNEGGVYVSTSPANFDTLTRTADGWTLLHKNSLEIEYFDADGRLIEKQDRNGNSVFLTYEGEYLTRVENDSGRWLEFSYTADGYIETVTAPEGRTISYTYSDDLLTSVTDGNGHKTVYAYDENKQLISITTPKGHLLMEQEYDEKHRVIWQKVGISEITAFEFSEDGLTTTTTDSYGYPTIHTYNGKGQIIRTEDAAGGVEEYGYNEKFQRIYYKDKLGREWTWTYDENGNRLTEDGPLGWHQEWAYNAQNRVLSQLTKVDGEQVRETTFEYDVKGNLTGITNAEGDSSAITYDERGLPTNIFDFNQNETINTYDPATGDLIKTENGAGDVVEYGYDGLGRMVELTNGRSFAYTYTYDQADNLTDINGPLGYHLGYRYDANDNLRLVIDPNDGETEYWYDISERVVRIENQLNNATIFEYDDMNNPIRLQDAEGREWFYTYDKLYRQTAVHGPEDTHTFFEYDAVGNIISTTECNSIYDGETCSDNRVTTYSYNALDQMVKMVENAVDGAGETADTNVTTEFSYDLVGNLLVLTDALDNQTLFAYNLLDQLVRQEDAEEQVTEYAYDANGNLIWLKNPRGNETTFAYDGANRLAKMTDADNQTWEYLYDGNGNLSHETDPLAVVTYYQYDALDRVDQLVQNFRKDGPLTSDQNVTTRFSYDLAGNLRFIYDPRGEYVTEHRYDAAHRRILTIDNEDGETEYGYDKVNNLVSFIDGNDQETTFIYDGLNRQIQITNPEDHSVRFTYDRLGNTLTITDARNHTTTFTYDGMNRAVLMVDAMQGEWHYEYDAMGNLLCEEDANGHANDCYTYDKVYRVLSVTDAEGHTDAFAYDENGNRLTWTDGNDHTTTYTYNVVDRLATLTNPETETTHYEYDPLGNQTRLIEADGIVTRYVYDPLYRLVTVNQNDKPGQPESADVNVDTHYVYDEVGNLLTIIDAELHETNFTYDGMNRLLTEVDADNNLWQYGYDAVGNRTWRIDANGNRTDYTYYPDNQPETISYELDGTAVAYSYDQNNNRTQMVDHLGTTTWVYDPLNRVTTVDDAFGRTLAYGYDAVGNRTSITYNDGRTVHYSYYDNDWLKTATDPETNVTSYERDGVGLMIQTTNPNETITTATYDKANRLLTLINEQISGARKTNSAFDYTYNDVGHRTQMVAEYGWRNPAVVTSDYTYDGLRRLIRDEDSEGVWTDYTFDRVGNRLVLNTNDDSLSPRPFDEKTVYYSYSDANRLLSLVGNTHPGSPGLKWQDNVGQTIHAFRHEVNAQNGVHIDPLAAQNLLGMADNLIALLEGNPQPSANEVTVAIEALRVQVQSDWAGGLIRSDGIANSLLVKLGLGDSATNNGANDEWQTQTFTYDPNGNRINTEYPGPQGPRVQGTDYTYDPENRLIVNLDYQQNLQGNRVDRAITTMEYDGWGRRLAKTYDPNEGGGGAKRVEYVFDGWDPVSEYNQWNPQYENFYRGDMNRIITMHHFPSGTAGQMYWYHYDGLGSVTGLTKQLGQSHHNYRYEPYGQIEMPPGNFTDPHNHYTFTGQEWDENMGLYEFYARKYDPVTGTWLSQDTYRGRIEEPVSKHRYLYVGANPTNRADWYGYLFGIDIPYVSWDQVRDTVGINNNVSQSNPIPFTNAMEATVLSLMNEDEVVLTGDALKAIKNDPAMQAYEQSLINETKAKPDYGKRSFSWDPDKEKRGNEHAPHEVGFGGQRWSADDEDWFSLSLKNPLAHKATWGVAFNELTWLLRHARIDTSIFVDRCGDITITYQLDDTLDLRPGDERSGAYNTVTKYMGLIYHDVLDGSEMRVKAEWTTTYQNK